MELKANCKINLGLRVVRRRDDGYHDIETVMMPVPGLFDRVSIEPFPDNATFPGGLGGSFADPFPFLGTTPPPYPSPPPVFPADSILEVTGNAVDCPPEKNLCMRALRLMQREFGIGEALIRLHKAIPSEAGLGGGSSDAAAVLRALNDEFVLELSDTELGHLAGQLGSDVPFFVHSGGNARIGAQFCTGRGEVMTPVEVDLAGKWLVIVKPDVAVSTAQAYAGVTPREGVGAGADADAGAGAGAGADVGFGSRLGASARRNNAYSLPEIVRRDAGKWRELLVNDFEESVFALYPEIGRLKQSLYDAGAVYASMSGSGSAVFAIFDERPALRFPDSVFLHTEQLT